MKNLSIKSPEDLLRKRFADKFEDNYPLSSVLPVGIGGVSDMYLTANSTAELIDAAKISISKKVPYVVLGAGTAVVVGESGFPGLAIKNRTSNVFRVGQSSRVVCDSGAVNANIISLMASVGLGGIEFLHSIPGTIGGAIVSGAVFGEKKISSFVREVSLFDPDNEKVFTVNADAFEEIRGQIFSGSLAHPPIVLTVTLQFAQITQDEIIRRLSTIKNRNKSASKGSLGHIFCKKAKELSFSKDIHKQLRRANVSYDQSRDILVLGSGCTPRQLKEAISIISNSLKEFGIEVNEKITYLGYYQQEDDYQDKPVKGGNL